MSRRNVVATALLLALLASLALAPPASAAKGDRKQGKARAAKAAEAAPEPAKPAEAAPEPAKPASDNAVVPVADNAVGPQGVVHETDITSTVVLGRPVAQAPPPESPSFFWAAVKMVIALGLVLAILLGISHLMKKYMERFGSGAAAPGRAITVTEARHVAPKTQVMVVEALGNRYLIGVTPTQVTLIDKVPGASPEGKG
jgi:flagellar biosynthetic protein FliO